MVNNNTNKKNIQSEEAPVNYKKQKLALLSLAAAIAVITFLVFLPSLKGEFLIWDDNLLISDNHNIRSLDLNFFKWAFTDVAIAAWYPVTVTSFAVDYAFWGQDPFGYHLTNNIFHALNTFLVFVLVFSLVNLGSTKKRDGIMMPLVSAIVTAVLFGIHPLRVESVAWIAERKDVLYSFFYILTILSYLKYNSVTAHKTRYYTLSIFFFSMSLMSKSMAVTLPIVLIILDYFPLRRLLPDEGASNIKKVLVEKIPFIGLSLLVSAVALMTHHETGALRDLEAVPVLVRFFVSMKGYIFYLYKMLWPTDLSPYYPYPLNVAVFSLEYMGALILFLIITAVSIYFFRKKKIIPAVWFYYVLTLLPVIGIAQTGSYAAANRYTYLPGLGPLLLVGLMAGNVFVSTSKKQVKTLLVVLFLVLTGVFINMTIKQMPVWKDTVSLWSYQIKLYPGRIPLAYLNRGVIYYEKGEFEKSIEDYSKVIEIDPRHAKAYSNRGSAHEGLGNFELAIKNFTKAIELSPELPGLYSNRGNALMRLKRYEGAIKDYNRAIKIDPEYTKAYSNRGVAYGKLGKYELAIRDYGRSIEIAPWKAMTYNNRGFTYESVGRYKEALRDYTKAVELEPGYAKVFNNRGNTYRKIGELKKAIDDYKKALRLDPGNSTSYFYLGLCYESMGEKERSIENIKKAAGLGNIKAADYLKKIANR